MRTARHSLSRAAVLLATTLAVALCAPAVSASAASAQELDEPARELVQAYGVEADAGPTSDGTGADALIAVAATAEGDGYWLADTRGGVFSFGAASFHGSAGGWPLNAPIVDLEAVPGGYWLASADGGVFSFGAADHHGSVGDVTLAAPVVAIAGRPDGAGYWLVATDGGVFSFGASDYYGSAAGVDLASYVVDIAAAPDGAGYWLVTASGEVLAFGSAEYHGDLSEFGVDDVIGISAAPSGGYYLARATGAVLAFGADSFGFAEAAPGELVDLAAHPEAGYLTLARPEAPEPEPSAPLVDPNHPFLVCTRAHESDSSGGYQAVSSSGKYRGAYQFSRSTWNSTAQHAGRTDLVGVDPAAAAPADQDFLALHLYQWRGASPWLGRCAGR